MLYWPSFYLSVLSLPFLITGLEKFVDENTVGLKNEFDDVCLSVKFRVEILNLQFNNTAAVPFDLAEGNVTGKCARESRSSAILSSTISHDERTKKLKFIFGIKEMRVKKVDELRWQLRKIVYSETFEGDSAVFESDNSSVIFSAPLNQKYVCKDRINVTLRSDEFK
ncbi:unnamed protein product [Caenorhabditis auriculariae]|uniref:Uncharacterized protein n=1 Tax=Caenorhabditis auriculariae TaxID=2777116 RepID=A0A8S1HE94_9PELO|nr:unnamed protein product [Caenorhabditis auriculariae]